MPDTPTPMPEAVEAAKQIVVRVAKASLDGGPINPSDIATIITEKMGPAIEAAFKEGVAQEVALNDAVVSDAGLERCWLRSKARAALGAGEGK